MSGNPTPTLRHPYFFLYQNSTLTPTPKLEIWVSGPSLTQSSDIPTNLTVFLQKKCDQYWPSEGTESYGLIQVRTVREEVRGTFILRTLSLRPLKGKGKKSSGAERTVFQYHYTNWPDHGTPSHPLPVLSFVKKSSAANPPQAGPIIVHCR